MMRFRFLHVRAVSVKSLYCIFGLIVLRSTQLRGLSADVGVGPWPARFHAAFRLTFRLDMSLPPYTDSPIHRTRTFPQSFPSNGVGPRILECQASIGRFEDGHGRPSGEALGASPNS